MSFDLQGEHDQDEDDMAVQPQATDALPARPNAKSTQENAVGAQYAQQALLSPLPQWLLEFGDLRVKRKLREPTQILPDEVCCLSLFPLYALPHGQSALQRLHQ